mmetsp:Transcript_25355/g.52770  ORF Transcript_25355/g.52770 Transcript_25355/m.52770 type:complete len:351 (-) Transcript_25355:73-1125(-)
MVLHSFNWSATGQIRFLFAFIAAVNTVHLNQIHHLMFLSDETRHMTTVEATPGYRGSTVMWSDWCENTYKPMITNSSTAFRWSDKRRAKKMVRKILPKLRIAKEYASVESADNITEDFLATLPKTFIMKSTHMSGGIVLVENHTETKCLKVPCIENEHNKTDLALTCAKVLGWNYGKRKGEGWYKRVKRRCMFEEPLPEVASKDFKDIRVWVFHGKIMMVMVDAGGKSNPQRSFLTPHLRLIPTSKLADPYPPVANFGKPIYWDRLLDSATRISEAVGTPFQRVDFFGFRDDFAFAEVTFSPASCNRGKVGFTPEIMEYYMGYVQTHPDFNMDPEAIFDIFSVRSTAEAQ